MVEHLFSEHRYRATVDFISAAILLFIIMDPLGNIPVFHALLGHYSPLRRLRIITREMLIAYAVLMLFLFAGETILGYLGLEQPALGVAGGVVLFLIALRMVFPELGTVTSLEHAEEDPFIVPLAVPMIAGPSAVAAVLLLVSREPEQVLRWWAALTVAWSASAVILLASGVLVEMLGRRALRALVRLSGMLLIMMAIQMLMDGIAGYLADVS
jgi:multiple antibiotic resistance protein